MGVVNTTYTFGPTDTITSSRMNNIIDETFFDSSAVDNSTIAIAANKLQVKTQGITSTQLADNAVTTGRITDLAVTTGKIADLAVTTGKITDSAVTTAKILDANVTTAKILDANVTAAKLNGAQTGTAPIYGVRAWANFNTNTNADVTGTFSRSGNTVTITVTGHGLIVGNLIFIDFTTGTGTVAPDGLYVVSAVIDANVFTVTSAASTTGTGTATLKRKTIRASGNISCVSAAAGNPVIPPTLSDTVQDGYYVANFSIAMPSANFAVLATCSEFGTFSNTSANDLLSGSPYNAQSAIVLSVNTDSTPRALLQNSVMFIG